MYALHLRASRSRDLGLGSFVRPDKGLMSFLVTRKDGMILQTA